MRNFLLALPWLLLAGLVVALDQGAKWLIAQNLPAGDVLRLTSFFNLVRVYNRGAAFSFLASAGGWQRWFFVALAVVAIIVITTMLFRRAAAGGLFAGSLALILGGAIGNLIDRLRIGYVLDFLDFHFYWLTPLFRGGHFPAFNIADAAITAGVIGLLLNEALAIIGGFGRKRVI
ncbi:MAG: lipoprotein signal peptidase [Ottowia sp.]|nr:lipoprotein signal peptidase [Ottowia sp.]